MCSSDLDGSSQDDIDIFFAQFCYRGQRHPELERLYFNSYHHLDERIPRIRKLPDSRVVHVSSLYTDAEMQTSLVYNEALPLGDTRDSLNVRLDGPDGSRIVWVIADPIDGDGWSSSQVGTVERLLPHIRQYVTVRQTLVSARALGSSAVALLDNPERLIPLHPASPYVGCRIAGHFTGNPLRHGRNCDRVGYRRRGGRYNMLGNRSQRDKP